LRKLEKQTLLSVRDELAALPWSDADIAGLIDANHGVISGLQQLLYELDKLRRVNLGTIAPAEDIPPDDAAAGV
jgi:hypothetical protein